MANRDGRDIARTNELRVLKSLHKYGWLRTRDLAALHWMQIRGNRQLGLRLEPLAVEASAMRMAQRTLSRLRRDHKVIHIQAPDGSTIYGLAEAGARHLLDLGISAKSGKDQVRRISMSYFHHRRLANEIAILASLQGYRVSCEAEISAGRWLGGTKGIEGKKPDVILRDGKDIWWIEVERSRKTAAEETKLRDFLCQVWHDDKKETGTTPLPDGYRLRQVVFICEKTFFVRLAEDLKKRGWTDVQIKNRVTQVPALYVTEAKILTRAS